MSANSRNLPTSNPTLQGRQTSQVLVGSHGVRSAISNTSTHPLLNPQRIANDYTSNIPQGNHVNTLTGQLAPQATTRLSPIDIHNFGKAQPMVESQIDQRMREQMRQAQEERKRNMEHVFNTGESSSGDNNDGGNKKRKDPPGTLSYDPNSRNSMEAALENMVKTMRSIRTKQKEL